MSPTTAIRQTCALCGEAKPLIRSHVFPESFYKYVYNKSGPRKFITMSSNEKTPVRLEQKGIREPLMCCECDRDIVGPYDNYIARWMHTDAGCVPQDYPYTIRCTNVDFSLLRLFQLSLLWRFHVAQGAGFAEFSIPDHAERIRSMVLDGDPGERFFFPCILIRPREIFDLLAGGIMCPITAQADPFPICRINAMGLLWLWFLTDDASSHPYAEASVAQTGDMHILKGTPEITEWIKQELVELNRSTTKKPNAHHLKRWGFE